MRYQGINLSCRRVFSRGNRMRALQPWFRRFFDISRRARGFNVAQPDQDGWGTFYSLPVAAALFDRPIVVIDQNGIGNLYQLDCSEEVLNNGQLLPEGDFKLLVQKLREKGQKPIAIYKSGPAHFQSVNLEP
ncbi:MAG: hypothetical protein ACKO8O_01985 [Betaproteobacteria bacterium]